jgi:hypothetical protein
MIILGLLDGSCIKPLQKVGTYVSTYMVPYLGTLEFIAVQFYKYLGCQPWEAIGDHSKLGKDDFFRLSRLFVSPSVAILLFFK